MARSSFWNTERKQELTNEIKPTEDINLIESEDISPTRRETFSEKSHLNTQCFRRADSRSRMDRETRSIVSDLFEGMSDEDLEDLYRRATAEQNEKEDKKQMADFIYNKSNVFNNAQFGKLETPLKMVIEHESDLARKKGGVVDWLFNVANSQKTMELIQCQDDFESFQPIKEGAGAENISMVEPRRKVIEFHHFTKEFIITKSMLDNTNYSIGAEAEKQARDFVHAYHLLQNEIASKAIANGKKTSMLFNEALVDLTTADGKPLFAIDHLYGAKEGHGEGTQSNLFGRNRYDSKDVELTLADVKDLINMGAAKIRGMKNENGKVMGYIANTIVIPGNLPVLKKYVEQTLGSSHEASSSNNDINIQFGNINLIILSTWEYDISSTGAAAQTYPMIFMSRAANQNLSGNMFFNCRSNSIEMRENGDAWFGNGYCRFGIGFGSYKHICLIESYSAPTKRTDVTDI